MAADALELLDDLAAELAGEGVTSGSLFGKPCLKVHGKAFACVFQEAMVFKLDGGPFDRAISLSGATLFDPSGAGRPMRQWVQVPAGHASEWRALAREALAYAGK